MVDLLEMLALICGAMAVAGAAVWAYRRFLAQGTQWVRYATAGLWGLAGIGGFITAATAFANPGRGFGVVGVILFVIPGALLIGAAAGFVAWRAWKGSRWPYQASRLAVWVGAAAVVIGVVDTISQLRGILEVTAAVTMAVAAVTLLGILELGFRRVSHGSPETQED